MRLIDKLLVTTIVFSSATCFAYEGADYYENEGELLFKVRGIFSNSEANLQAKPNAGQSKPKGFLQRGYGLDTATTIFFDNYLSAELSLGVRYYKIKSSELNKAAIAYGGEEPLVDKKKNALYHVPLTGTIQYHLAPYGAIRPYLGAGYHIAYNYTRSKNFKMKVSHGPVLQLGIDFVSMEDRIFTLDIKQYFSKPDIDFDKNFLGERTIAGAGEKVKKNLKSKAKWNPLVISAGIAFKF